MGSDMHWQSTGQNMADGLKGFLARLSTDDPETNGPRVGYVCNFLVFGCHIKLVRNGP